MPPFHYGRWFSMLYSHHYENFYPVYGPKLRTILAENCTEALVTYQHRNATCSKEWLDLGWGLTPPDCGGYDLLNCILKTLPDTAKADMAAAGIVLGLLPVILSLIGSSTVEIGLLALRRPFLAALIGLASPAVNPLRTFDYRDPFDILRRRGKTVSTGNLSTVLPWVQSAIQYLVVFGALANLALVATDLTRKAIVGNDPNRDYQVLVWTLWAFAIHIAGSGSLALRVKFQRLVERRRKSWWRMWIGEELVPCGEQSGGSFTIRSESYWFIGLAWATSVATIVHIVYGTLSFSGMLFLSGGEGMVVLVRCLASVAVCRMVLMYELNGLGRVADIEPEEPVLGMLSRQGTDLSNIDDSKIAYGSAVEISYTKVSPGTTFQDPFIR